MPVPPGTRGRDLTVEIKKKRLKVGLKGKEPIMEGELCKEVQPDDSTWTLGKPSSLLLIRAFSADDDGVLRWQMTRKKSASTSKSSTSRHGGKTS